MFSCELLKANNAYLPKMDLNSSSVWLSASEGIMWGQVLNALHNPLALLAAMSVVSEVQS